MKTPLFAERLRQLREAKGLSQSELARILAPLTPQAVQKWEAGLTTPRQSKWKALAQALSTSVANVIEGTELEGFPESTSQRVVSGGRVVPLRGAADRATPRENGAVPLISWDQAVEWGPHMDSANVEEAQDWMLCPFSHSASTFVLEVGGESNYDPGGPKSYSPGDLVYVDPTREPTNRCMVVIRIDHEERAQLKQLLMDERGTRMLKSLNPAWPERIAPMPDGSKIVGVVIGKWVPE